MSTDSHDFRTDLEYLINSHSRETKSDTPDFVLARYLDDCLRAFDKAVNARTDWYTKYKLNEQTDELP